MTQEQRPFFLGSWFLLDLYVPNFQQHSVILPSHLPVQGPRFKVQVPVANIVFVPSSLAANQPAQIEISRSEDGSSTALLQLAPIPSTDVTACPGVCAKLDPSARRGFSWPLQDNPQRDRRRASLAIICRPLSLFRVLIVSALWFGR